MVNGIYRMDGSTSAQGSLGIFGETRARVSLGRASKRCQYDLKANVQESR